MSVRATFDFDPEEHYRSLREVTRRTPARYVSWVFVAVAAVLLYSNALRYWREMPPVSLLLTGLPYVLLGVFWLGLIPFVQRRHSRKLPMSDPSVRGPQVREVDDVGFHSHGNGVSLDVPWAALLKVIETNEFFLFYSSKQLAYYVPKRSLRSSDIETLRDLAAKHMGTEAFLAQH